MKLTLILGYGNMDRQDDGAAWHILARLNASLGRPALDSCYDAFPGTDQPPELLFLLQLTPELAEMLSVYERVCFVDAHTGAVPDDLNIQVVRPDFQSSPFTHHMTPGTVLALTQALYGHVPQAILVSVRGVQFGFSRDLSSFTEKLAEQAVNWILNWLEF